MKNTIIVCESGWIIVGIIKKKTESEIRLKDSSVVRKWVNGKGIGGLADVSNKNEYTLDYIGDVDIMQNKVLFKIPCNW